MFLALMALLLLGGTALVAMRRESLAPERSPGSLLARETLILVSTSLLVVLTLVVLVSTLVVPLSTYLRGQTIQVTPSFYNNALVPVGLTLAAMTAVAPLLRWGAAPGPAQRRALCVCLIVGLAAMGVGYWLGIQHLVSLLVTAWASVAGAAFLGALVLDAQRRSPGAFCIGLWRTVRDDRRQYTGYIVHLGFMVLAIGITGSSLGSRRYEIDMDEGASVTWANREIRYVRLDQRTLSDKLIAEAVLEVSRNGQAPVTMRPARHLHLLQNEWTTEVDIHSAWSGDFYAILHAGLGDGKVALTFVENPMMAWIWLGGLIISVSALSAMVPTRRGQQAAALVDNESERPALGAVDNHVKKQAA
jgi:cytochrome c-type biogenesis protein CcmF